MKTAWLLSFLPILPLLQDRLNIAVPAPSPFLGVIGLVEAISLLNLVL